MKTENKGGDKVKLTTQSVIDELVGAGTAAAGIVGGSFAMQMLKSKLNLNPWLVAGGGFAIGFGGRLASNLIPSKQLREIARELSTGIMTAGALDGAKKVYDVIMPTPAAGSIAEKVKTAIPTLSGPANDLRNGNYGVPTSNFLNGVTSKVLNALPTNSNILN